MKADVTANLAGELSSEALKLYFGRRLTLRFRGSVVASDAGLLAFRELGDALGLSAMAGEKLADARTGKNGRHALVGMLRQAVFERLRHDPAMRWIVGGKAASGRAASASQMRRFETRWLTAEKNLPALADLCGQWIDKVHARRTPRGVVLEMDSSVGPTPSLKEKLIKIGAKVISHGRYVAFQMAEVAVPRNLFADIPRLIPELRPPPVASTA